MITSFNVGNGNTEYSQHRCYSCGYYWAHERFAAPATRCPVCAGKLVDELYARIAKLERGNAALRGVINRKKAKR